MTIQNNVFYNLNRVVIASPGGNDTALVFDKVSRDKQGTVSKLIQKNYPDVEQVMFVEQTENGYYGQMAGGEFCGNATRSLAFVLAQQGFITENEIVSLTVSGSSEPLNILVQNGEAMAQMPVNPKSVAISDVADGVTLVELEGISFIVLEEQSVSFAEMKRLQDLQSRKNYVLQLIKEYGFSEKLASGVLVIDKQNNTINMDPYVYVSATGSLYFETACGSGTTAIGLIEAQRARQSLTDYAVYQPSGMPIKVSVDYEAGNFKGASINGPVAITFDGPMILSEIQLLVTESASIAQSISA